MLVVVLVFSFVTGQLLRRLRRRFVLPAAGIYVLVGIAVGPLGLDIVDERVITSLQPVLSLLLGLTGFGMGLLLRRQLADARGLEVGLAAGAVVVAAVGGATWAALYGLRGGFVTAGTDPWAPLWPAVAVGAVAAVCDAQLLRSLADRAGARGPVRELTVTLAVSSSIVAVAALGLSLALARARLSAVSLSLTPTEWLLAALASGVACGVLFVLFVGRWANDQRAFLATVAIITFASGIAAAIGISPLLAGMIAGLTASVLSAHADAVGDALERLEAPALIGIMILAGAMWRPPSPVGWLLVVVYLGIRPLALRSAAFVLPRLVAGLPRAHRLGSALLPQGALGAAIAANFAQVFPEHGPLVLTVGLVGLLVSDAVGYATVRRVLADAGEIVHRAAEPPQEAQ
ncbi:MAG: hypothetical protein R3F59_05510 [Myxococcota bacterium]